MSLSLDVDSAPNVEFRFYQSTTTTTGIAFYNIKLAVCDPASDLSPISYYIRYIRLDCDNICWIAAQFAKPP